MAVLLGHPTERHVGTPGRPSSWSPLTAPMPPGVHLLTLQRRAFLRDGGHTPDYPSGPAQGVLRLQHVYQDSLAPPISVDVGALFTPALRHMGLEERTLSIARPTTDVVRRCWRGVGVSGAVVTPGKWRTHPGDDSRLLLPSTASNRTYLVELTATQIRSYVFDLG